MNQEQMNQEQINQEQIKQKYLSNLINQNYFRYKSRWIPRSYEKTEFNKCSDERKYYYLELDDLICDIPEDGIVNDKNSYDDYENEWDDDYCDDFYRTKHYHCIKDQKIIKQSNDFIDDLLADNDNWWNKKSQHWSYKKKETFPLYTTMSRHYIQQIPTRVARDYIKQAIDMNRYHRNFYDNHNNLVTEGIHGAIGPDNFNIEDYDTMKLGIDQYESIYIYDVLVRLNKLLEKYNVKTVQSGIAYYTEDVTFSPAFIQLPFIEFSGSKDTIPIMKAIVNHELMKGYYTMSFTEENSRDKSVIRTTVMRPYLDSNKDWIPEFDDTEFWKNIEMVVEDINSKDIILPPNTMNDVELDKTKDWFILDSNGDFLQIDDKDSFNPIVEEIPLSTLDVRYDRDIELFKRNLY
jgi:hypothetical protein